MKASAPADNLEAGDRRPAVRVLLVDDSPAVRRELRALLELVADVTIAGEAADGAQALEQATRLRPDAVVLDLELPDLDGVTAGRQLRSLLPHARLVVLTVHDSEAHRRRAFAAGIDAYLVKGGPLAELIQAITTRANAV